MGCRMILHPFLVATITIIKYNSEVTWWLIQREEAMRKLNRMIAVILESVMFCLMPVTDMNVMAEDISSAITFEF